MLSRSEEREKEKPKFKVMNPYIQNAIQEKRKLFIFGNKMVDQKRRQLFFLLEKKLKTIELRRLEIANRNCRKEAN